MSARTAATVKKPGLHADGGGLYVQVTMGADGGVNRSWIVRYAATDGRRREMGLSPVALVDLGKARELALAARRSAKAGIDPIAARKATRLEARAKQQWTFAQCASNFISWGNLPRLLQAYRSREVPYLELGTFFLVLTAAYVIVLSLGVIGVPLVLLRKGSVAQGLLPRSLIYFGGLGLGYMILEMVLIQKTVLFLGDPVYSVALVVGSLLFSSSLGSALSPSLKTALVQYRWRLPWLLVVVVALYVAALSPLLSAMLSMPAWARFLLFPLVVAPLGIVLGIPFPLGLSHLAERAPRLVPLAWGMNGCCSVVASSTAVLSSMELGFGLLQLLAVGAYAGAFLAFPAVRPDASRTHG